jgi:hypothetical protein
MYNHMIFYLFLKSIENQNFTGKRNIFFSTLL